MKIRIVATCVAFAASFACSGTVRAEDPRVTVHVRAHDDGATLERLDGDTWVPVCPAPCDRELPLTGEYRIGGSVRPSKTLQLRGGPGERVTLDVDGKSDAAFHAGVALIPLGAAGMVIGGGLASSALFSSDRTKMDLGWAAFGVGLLALVPGIVLASTQNTSRVEQSVDRGASRRVQVGANATLPSTAAAPEKSNARSSSGVALTMLGSFGVAAGLAAIATANTQACDRSGSPWSDQPQTCGSQTPVRVGGAAVAVGVASIIGGLALSLGNPTSGVVAGRE